MTREEHILSCVAEECNETAQRVSKALRFGVDQVYTADGRTNAELIMAELYDLLGAVAMAQKEGILPPFVEDEQALMSLFDAKRRKIETHMAKSGS